MKSVVKKVLFIKASVLMFVFVAGCQQQKANPSQEHKQIIDKAVDIWNGGNLDELGSIIDPDFVRTHNTQPDVNGIEGLKQVIIRTRTLYPDFHIDIDSEVYGENNYALRWKATGTYTSADRNPIPMKWWGITIVHIENGKVTREIVSNDTQSIMEQLGTTIAISDVKK